MSELPIIVTEGEFDHLLIGTLLSAKGVTGFSIAAGSGPEGAVRVARKKRLERNAPVLVVIDADTPNEDEADARAEDLTDLLRLGRANSPAWVVCVVPELEVLLFRHPSLLKHAFPTLQPAAYDFGLEAPAGVLRKEFGPSWKRELMKAVEHGRPRDLCEMASDEVIADIAEFVRDPYRFAPRTVAAPRPGFGT